MDMRWRLRPRLRPARLQMGGGRGWLRSNVLFLHIVRVFFSSSIQSRMQDPICSGSALFLALPFGASFFTPLFFLLPYFWGLT
jgi:hypothetical protein